MHFRRPSLAGLLSLAFTAAAFAACGGGGTSSSPAPRPIPSGALGVPASALNHTLSFAVIIPPCGGNCTAAVRRSPRDIATSSPAAQPYISPATAGVSLQLISVDGQALQTVTPPVIAQSPCVSAKTGCTLTVPGVPAGVGSNGYAVRALAVDGSLISSSIIAIDVHADGTSDPTTIGGNVKLSVGGYVSALEFVPSTLTLDGSAAHDTTVVIQALDAGKAILVGNVQYAVPITVTVDDTQNFSLNGQSTITAASPANNTIAIHSPATATRLITKVRASSADANGPVTAPALSLVVVAPPPTPTPTPAPGASTPPPRSLYVLDDYNQRIAEYDVPDTLARGGTVAASPVPRRVVNFNPLASDACSAIPTSPGQSANVYDIAADDNGNLFAAVNCGASQAIYQYAPTATKDDPPIATFDISSFTAPDGTQIALSNFGASRLIYDRRNSNATKDRFLLAGVSPLLITLDLAPAIGATPVRQTPTLVVAENYDTGAPFPDLPGFPGTAANGMSFQAGISADALDLNGNAYFSSAFAASLPAAQSALANLPAIVGEALSSSAKYGNGVFTIAGDPTQLGVSNPIGPIALAADDARLYAVVTEIQQTSSGAFNALAGCAPASANAAADLPNAAGGVPLCRDGLPHQTLAAYDLNAVLTAPGAFTSPGPVFMLGADANLAVTRIGCSALTTGSFLAIESKIAYYVNTSGPNCANPSTAAPPFTNEVDIYSLPNGGFHTDLAPRAVLSNVNAAFTNVALGGRGSGTGGTLSISRRVNGSAVRAAQTARRFQDLRVRYLQSIRSLRR